VTRTAADQKYRQVLVLVQVSIADGTSIDNQRMVKE
jgi:hypothetical protein